MNNGHEVLAQSYGCSLLAFEERTQPLYNVAAPKCPFHCRSTSQVESIHVRE